MSEAQTVVFSVEQLNQILQYLGEVPAKYSLDLIAFIKKVADEQLVPAATQEAPAAPVDNGQPVQDATPVTA